MALCDECGSTDVSLVTLEGSRVEECGLCGALSGDDVHVSYIMMVRQAREEGIDPLVYPLTLQLDKIDGLRVVDSEAGDPEARTWPYVQMAFGPSAERSLENVTKSIALSNAGGEIHWVLELEYRHHLVVTLKPRFHRGPESIGAEEIARARADLDRLCRNLGRDMFLSWWRA